MVNETVYWQPEAGKLPVRFGNIVGYVFDPEDEFLTDYKIKAWDGTHTVEFEKIRWVG